MALDKQRILGELGSVMKQLQSADCGCLGKLFGGSQQATPPMGNPLPTCGGCRRSHCCGHGYNNSVTPINQPNISSMPMDVSHYSGNMCGFGPQIVNMMRGDHNPQKVTGQGQGLTGPMVIDAPQSPHGKLGLSPITPPTITQQGQFHPMSMSKGDVSGQFQQHFTPHDDPQTMANMQNTTPWSQQNMANPTTHYIPKQQSQPHGQHTQGIAKFNQMFPGVKQGLEGDLGFDPMAIAIQMNPDNHLKTAMNTMNNIMNDNKGMNNIGSSPTTRHGNLGISNVPQNFQKEPNMMTQQNIAPVQNTQNYVNQITSQQTFPGHNITQGIQDPNQHNTTNTFGQSQQNQEIYANAINPSINQQALQYDESQQVPVQQQYEQMVHHGQQQMMNINSETANLPTTYEKTTAQMQPSPAQITLSNELQVQQMIKDPILPADTSRNITYMQTNKQNNYGYNTLGQPVEMLPAKMFHPPEPTLPQTLSPQPEKSRTNPIQAVNVKATISKTSLMGNKPVGRIPSRNQLQHIYNQYKGSQSFTQQNVRHPGEGSCSDGRLNVPQVNVSKVPPVPEKVGGDTMFNNPPSEQVRTNKLDQIMGQIGDVPVAKPGGDSLSVKEAPVPVKKCRNGLQDMVFSSYPTSTAWSFHGHGRTSTSPNRYGSRRY